MVTETAAPHVTVSMSDIRAPSWWTGVRLVAHGQPPPVTLFKVELLTNDAVPLPAGAGRWIQAVGAWMPLPWPIPAKMAAVGDFRIRITPVHVVSEPPLVKCELSFHDLDEEDVDSRERYAFLGYDNRLAMHWNGPLLGGGSVAGALPLYLGAPHKIVPRMDIIRNINPATSVSMEYISPVGWDALYMPSSPRAADAT